MAHMNITFRQTVSDQQKKLKSAREICSNGIKMQKKL